MHLDRRFVVVTAVSLLWALVVSAAFFRLGGGGGRTRAASRRQVVVATRPLAAGGTVDRDAVKLRSVPEDVFPAGAFSRVEDVLERPVISAIQAEEPVVEARLALKGSGAGLGPMIPPGMRAISVRVNDVVGVAGFVLPGMRVDVLVTGKPPNRNDTETQTVLQNITVLSAGQTITADGRSQPIMAPVVTLMVTPGEAEALTLANTEGHIQLVLRNSTDQVSAPTRGRRLHELYKSTSANMPAPVEEVREVAPRRVRPTVVRTTERVAVPVAAPTEPEQMVILIGALRKVQVFAPEQGTK